MSVSGFSIPCNWIICLLHEYYSLIYQYLAKKKIPLFFYFLMFTYFHMNLNVSISFLECLSSPSRYPTRVLNEIILNLEINLRRKQLHSIDSFHARTSDVSPFKHVVFYVCVTCH